MWTAVLSLAIAGPEMIPAEVFAAATAHKIDESPIELPLRDGGTFAIRGRDKPALLSFWASWCGPCRNELPALAVWAKSHPELDVVAVNVDRQRAPADKFLNAVRFDLPIAYDPDARQLGRFGVTSMPTMFLFDRTGVLSWQHVGYSAEKGMTELDTALEALK